MAGLPKLAAVIGAPVMHSLSPLIHSIWAHRAGIDAFYIPVEAGPTYEEFIAVVDGLRAAGFAGANVTLPHKEHALRYADTATEYAKNIGAANMLTFNDNAVHAACSDGAGFATALSPHLPDKKKYRLLILGAGGAAKAIARTSRIHLSAENSEYNEVLICNRTEAKARALAELVGACVVKWDHRHRYAENVDIIVNTTSLGMTGQPPLDFDLSRISQSAIVFDIVYTPLETPLLREAKKRGNPTVDGLEMLMWQAVPGFEVWFGDCGVRAHGHVDDDLRSQLVAELKRRQAA